MEKSELVINECKLLQTLMDIVLGGELDESTQKKQARKEVKDKITNIFKKHIVL